MGLINLAEELGNVSKAGKLMGFSRDTFYRYKELLAEGGMENLIDRSRSKPNLKNRIDPTIEKHVLEIAVEFPAFGQVRASNELRKRGVFVSPAGIRCVWMRDNLETMKKRLKALEVKVQEQGTANRKSVSCLRKEKRRRCSYW